MIGGQRSEGNPFVDEICERGVITLDGIAGGRHATPRGRWFVKVEPRKDNDQSKYQEFFHAGDLPTSSGSGNLGLSDAGYRSLLASLSNSSAAKRINLIA